MEKIEVTVSDAIVVHLSCLMWSKQNLTAESNKELIQKTCVNT